MVSTAGARYIYDKAVVDRPPLHNMFSEEGDIGWRLLLTRFPVEDDYYAFADRAAGADYTADCITIANIGPLCSFGASKQDYGGAPRPIQLCERSGAHMRCTYRDAAKATADYIYAVCKLSGLSYSNCLRLYNHTRAGD